MTKLLCNRKVSHCFSENYKCNKIFNKWLIIINIITAVNVKSEFVQSTMVINDYIREGWETLAGKKAIFQQWDKNGTSEHKSNG